MPSSNHSQISVVKKPESQSKENSRKYTIGSVCPSDNESDDEEQQDVGKQQEKVDTVSDSSSSNEESSYTENEDDESSDSEPSSENTSSSNESIDAVQVIQHIFDRIFVTTDPHRPCYKDQNGNKMEPRRKNIADIMQEIVYLMNHK